MRINIDVSNGKLVWFSSDNHHYHSNIIKHDNRPFVDVIQMNETIINNWNSLVGPKDEAFYLGDLSFGTFDETKEIVNQLNGKIHFIMGNHDRYKDIVALKRFESINDYVELGLFNGKEKTYFNLMHYPIYSWNKIHHGYIHVHGHCHGNMYNSNDGSYYKNRKAIDVGCNIHNYYPLSHIEIIEKMKDI